MKSPAKGVRARTTTRLAASERGGWSRVRRSRQTTTGLLLDSPSFGVANDSVPTYHLTFWRVILWDFSFSSSIQLRRAGITTPELRDAAAERFPKRRASSPPLHCVFSHLAKHF